MPVVPAAHRSRAVARRPLQARLPVAQGAGRGGGVTGLLTARAVGELLGYSTETVLRWTRRGELPVIRLPGGGIRYRQTALDAWLAERATPRQGALTTPPGAARNGT